MKFALLGIDDSTLVLVKAIATSPEHTLAGFCEVDESALAKREAFRGLVPEAREFVQWEALLDSRLADAVVVARSKNVDLRGEQLRRLVQGGRPMLVSHPICDSMLGYEIDMARSESGSPLLAYLPERWHPAVAELPGWLDEPSSNLGAVKLGTATVGTVEQWIFERSLADRSRINVRAHFARDVDLIRTLGGDVTRLAAFGPADLEAAYSTLHVQLTAARQETIRWSVTPAPATGGGGTLTIVGSLAKVVLSMPAGDQPWTLQRAGANEPTIRHFADWRPADTMIERLERTMRGDSAAAPTWLEAVRDIELAEAIDRSLRRARAVDLKVDQASESSNFKGTMASVGCALLLVGMLVLLLVGVADSFKPLVEWPAQVLAHWPKLLLGILGLFLAMQFLLLITRKPPQA